MLAIFNGNCRLSRKQCKIGRYYEVMGAGLNGIIFDDLEWPLTWVSRSLYTYKSNISKMVHFRDKVTKNINRKSYTIYGMVPLSMILSDFWPRFQGHDIFRHWIRTSIGSHMRSIEWWYLQWCWQTPNVVFKNTNSNPYTALFEYL